MKLKNKIALITGSSRGIGKVIATLFAKEGAKVIINYLERAEEAHAVAKLVGNNNSICIQADVGKEEDVKRLVSKAIEKFGKIDILVNNAGLIIRDGDWKSNVDIWHRVMEVNLTSAWLAIKEVAPIMIKNGGGTIVNISSIYGLHGAASVLAYSCAKGGLNTLTRSFAKELSPTVRVNAVAPGNIITDMTKGANNEIIEFFKQQTLLGRNGEPNEIAKAVLFLACDDSSYITGEVLVADGGYGVNR